MTNSTKRWAVSAGAIGLVSGLALGATGLASAVTPTPAPKGPEVRQGQGHGKLPPGLHKMRDGHRGGGGLVSAISPTSLTVRTPGGSKTVGLTSSTTYYEGPAKATREAIDVGDIVRVLLADPNASSPVASVVTVVPARVAGWVTTVEGSTVTVKDRGGFTRTITTSSATKVMKDGAEATAAAITVGSFIHAHGKVASDGTTLEATRIGVGAPAKARKLLREKRDMRGGREAPPMGIGPAGEDPEA